VCLHQRLGEHPDTLMPEVEIAGLSLAHKLRRSILDGATHVVSLDVMIGRLHIETYAMATVISASVACSYTISSGCYSQQRPAVGHACFDDSLGCRVDLAPD
jgi:hypothetical protein